MRTCTRCHSENFQDVKFCNFCGSRMPRAVGASLFDDGPELVLGTAVPVHEAAKQSNPQEAYRFFMHGRSKLASGSVAEAIALFQRALDADPGDPKVRQLLDRAIRLRQRASLHAARRGEALPSTSSSDEPVLVACQDEDGKVRLPEPVALFPTGKEVLTHAGQARSVQRASASSQLPSRDEEELAAAPAARSPESPRSSLRPVRAARGAEADPMRAQSRISLNEALSVIPSYRPAELLDAAPESAIMEMAVSLLLVLGVFAFAYLLVF